MKVYTDIILKALEGKKFNSVLEVASGNQQNLVAIKQKYPDVKTYGFDVGAKGENIKDGNFKDKKWPFDRKFDVVFSMASIILIDAEWTHHIMERMDARCGKYMIFIEAHSDKATMKGKTFPYSDPYVIRNYVKLLEKYGYKTHKITYPPNVWPGWAPKGEIIWGKK